MKIPGLTAPGPEPTLKIDWRVAVASAAILAAFFAALAVPWGLRGTPAQPRAVFQPQVIMWGLWLLLLPLVVMVARRAHVYGVATPRALLLHICGAAVISLIHGVLWGILRWNLGPGNLKSLPQVIEGMVAFVYGGNVLRYVVIASAYHAFAFRAEVQERKVQEARLVARLAQTRLEALEARLHPHFLFNALNTVSALIRTNPAAAQTVVEHLGDLLRAALNAEPGKEVTLADELALLDRYVAIQHARFSDRLHVTIDAAPDTLAARVPQMVLQPFVENAIQHGIAPREAPGAVRVDATRRNGMLRLTVRDDGVGFGRASQNGVRDKGSGIGINNTRARLTELYGATFTLDVGADQPSGTIATIELPFHTEPR